MIKCLYKFLTSVFICFILLFIIGCNKNNYDQEINSLKEECSNKDKELENKTKEVEKLLKDLEDKEKELNDKKTNLDDKNQEIENKTKEVEKLLKDLEDKEKELEEALYNNEINGEELSALKKAINELELLISQNNSVINDKQTQIDSLLTSNKLDSECINIISKILSTGISLDEYLLFQENNQKVKDDEELKDLLDRIYYFYNYNNSISHLKEIAKADSNYFVEVPIPYGSHGNDIVVTTYIPDKPETAANTSSFRLRFFEFEEELQQYLSEVSEVLDSTIYNSLKVGKNYLLVGSSYTYKAYYNEYKKIGQYLDNLFETCEYKDIDECFNEISKIIDENNYQLNQIKTNDRISDFYRYYVGKDGVNYFEVLYLEEENYLDHFYKTYSSQSSLTKEALLEVYKEIYFFGRIAIFCKASYYNLEIEDTKDMILYKYIKEYGVNGYDYYISEYEESE